MKKQTAPDNMSLKNIQELNNQFLQNAFSLIMESASTAPDAPLLSPAGSACNSPSFCAMLQLQQAGSMKITGQVLKNTIWEDSIPFSLQVPLQHYIRCLIYLSEDGFDCRDYFCRAIVFDQEQAMFFLFVASISDPSLGFILLSPENMEKPVCPSPGIYDIDVPITPVSSIADALKGNKEAGQQAYNIFPEALSNINKAQSFTLAFFASTPLAATYDSLDILFLYGRESDVYQSILWKTHPSALVRRHITGNRVLRQVYALSHDADTAGFLQDALKKVEDAVHQLSSMDEEVKIYSIVLDSIRNAPENIFLAYILRSLLQAADMWNSCMEPDAYKELVCRQIAACRDMADVWNQLGPYIKKPGMIPRQETFRLTPYYMGFCIAPTNGLLPFMLHYLYHMSSYVSGIDKCHICSAPVFSVNASAPICQSCARTLENETGNIRNMCIDLTPSVIYFRKKNRNISKYLCEYRVYIKRLKKEILASGEMIKEKSAYVTDLEIYINDCQKQVAALKKKFIADNADNKDMPQDALEKYDREIDNIKDKAHDRYVDCKRNILLL